MVLGLTQRSGAGLEGRTEGLQGGGEAQSPTRLVRNDREWRWEKHLKVVCFKAGTEAGESAMGTGRRVKINFSCPQQVWPLEAPGGECFRH